VAGEYKTARSESESLASTSSLWWYNYMWARIAASVGSVTDAVTSLRLQPSGAGSFVAGSRFALYGD
jgi:hypothetical protein